MEGTSEDASRQDISDQKTVDKPKRRRLKERPAVLRGIPLNLCCRVCDFTEFTGIDPATIERMESVGFKTYNPGTQAAWLFTSEFHSFIASGVQIPPAEKKKRAKK
jgi:hypothetical protein